MADAAADLNRVRTGDVRAGARPCEQLREVIGGVVPRVGELSTAVVEDRDELRVRRQRGGLIILLVLLIVDGKAAIEEQAVGVRSRPFGD
jgi:hypothetical protein